jgi:2-hydroxy-3-oxopropionate reductase
MSFNTSSRIGFIGLGVMGAGMAHCLLRAGHSLGVHARTAEALTPFVAAGAHAYASPQELGQNADLVILSLPDAAAVESVLFGPQGLAAGLAPGSCVIDTSTIAASSAQQFGHQLAQAHIDFLDAPVSGGQPGAIAGTLTCMVGGSASTYAACAEVLQAFSQSLTHVGDIGAGQTVKACNQVAVAGAMLGMVDAISIAKSQGLDLNVMRQVLLGGAARSFSMEKHAPRVIEGNYVPGFRARLMLKDLRLALETAQTKNAGLAVAPTAQQLLSAMCDAGHGDLDWSGVALEVLGRN